MPRSMQEIIDHADELARRFEDDEPGRPLDPDVLKALRVAAVARAKAEQTLTESVVRARRAGLSWSVVGSTLGTSGEAARQRYKEAAAR